MAEGGEAARAEGLDDARGPSGADPRTVRVVAIGEVGDDRPLAPVGEPPGQAGLRVAGAGRRHATVAPPANGPSRRPGSPPGGSSLTRPRRGRRGACRRASRRRWSGRAPGRARGGGHGAVPGRRSVPVTRSVEVDAVQPRPRCPAGSSAAPRGRARRWLRARSTLCGYRHVGWGKSVSNMILPAPRCSIAGFSVSALEPEAAVELAPEVLRRLHRQVGEVLGRGLAASGSRARRAGTGSSRRRSRPTRT